MLTLKIRVESDWQDSGGGQGSELGRVHSFIAGGKAGKMVRLVWEVPPCCVCWGVRMSNGQLRSGESGERRRKSWLGDTHRGVIRHIGGSWRTWCPKHHFGDEQPATLLLLCDGWARGGWGRASLIITASSWSLSSLGGAKSSLWAQTLCFPYSGRHFPRQTLDMIIMLVSKLI